MGSVIAPERGSTFVDSKGVPLPRPMRWIEEVSRIVNTLGSSFKEIGSGVSPYPAIDGDFLLVDMDAGDVDIVLPSSGKVSVSRKHTTGSANALTLIGTVNGEVDPEILFDGSCATMAYITEWRYV